MSVSRAEALNRNCECVGTDTASLRASLNTPFLEAHRGMFSEIPLFVAAEHVEQMRRAIEAIENVVRLSAYRAAVLARAAPIARHAPAARGVFVSYDFHISPRGPRLIEVNTNSGGALLNAALRDWQQACCPEVAASLQPDPNGCTLQQEFFTMFLREWRLARGDVPLRHIAIVDDDPRLQFLFPEFELFRQLFEAGGVSAAIVDARELKYCQGVLEHSGKKIDLVYNRLTDFYFNDAAHVALRAAYLDAAAVVTPHPRAHALYADKRNLALLSNAIALREMGAAPSDIEVLRACVPTTRIIDATDDNWWTDRKQWFFKPARGFGGRGSYRGDKMTRRVFAEVMGGEYVAQELTPPSERFRGIGDAREAFKVDIRNYVYDGKTQLMAARLYQGQTTNFRTAGGGFAPVYTLDGGTKSR